MSWVELCNPTFTTIWIGIMSLAARYVTVSVIE